MSCTGYILFVYKEDAIQQMRYNHKGRRETIIENWKKQYRKRFTECAIHISPDYYEEVPRAKQDMRRGRIRDKHVV